MEKKTTEVAEFDRRAMANARRLREFAAGAAERARRVQQATKTQQG